VIPVKVCGITSAGDAHLAAAAGAAAIGMVFWAGSPRVVTAEAARTIVTALPPFITTVGVFVNTSAADALALADEVGLDLLQLHGDEEVADWHACRRPLLKALTLAAYEDSPWRGRARAILLDADDRARRGGTGATIDWDAARHCAAQGPVVLAGGLTADNVAHAITTVRPAAIDVSSGVEREPGRKDAARLAAFFAAVRGTPAAPAGETL
jgi:phosphoribosylanthranilate isomerase